jgi:hypothetical protein
MIISILNVISLQLKGIKKKCPFFNLLYSTTEKYPNGDSIYYIIAVSTFKFDKRGKSFGYLDLL